MTPGQWDLLLNVIAGRERRPPVGFIIDSPWLPGWAGMSILDYYASEACWLQANLAAVRRWPDVLFLPGFWSEFGMCTEPSAFGALCSWPENEFPFAKPLPGGLAAIAAMDQPDPRTDGLAPFVLKRLAHARPAMEEAGHQVRFAVARGPWNIAAFLGGTTEFMMALHESPEQTHAALRTITRFLVDWLALQKQAFPTIEGIFILDDFMGFVGADDFIEYALPYLKQCFAAFDAKVRFFHNDAAGLAMAPSLAAAGVNLFNFSYKHPIAEMRRLAGTQVTLLGNVPPRDVMALGGPDEVRRSVRECLGQINGDGRLILSCGGGMPPGVPTENIQAFVESAGCLL